MRRGGGCTQAITGQNWSVMSNLQPFIALDTSYLFLLFRSFQFYCPFWGCCAWDFRVGVVSHCTMGMFWGLQHFCYWLVQRYAWNWVKIRPPTENSPMMQFDPSPVQSPRQLQMAHVQNVKILTWLRGFLVIFLYLVWFSLYSSLLGIARQWSREKFAILTLNRPKASESF